jgi:hypothetical protein
MRTSQRGNILLYNPLKAQRMYQGKFSVLQVPDKNLRTHRMRKNGLIKIMLYISLGVGYNMNITGVLSRG